MRTFSTSLTFSSGVFPLLLLLSCFSRVRLCATPQTAAHQAPPSLGFSRQEHWSGLPFPSPMHESEKSKWSRSVVSDSSRAHGLQLPGSSVHGIFQARVLEWGAIAFSKPSLILFQIGACLNLLPQGAGLSSTPAFSTVLWETFPTRLWALMRGETVFTYYK